MSTAAVKTEPELLKASAPARFRATLLVLLAVYLAAWAYTQPHFMGDTTAYAYSILRHSQGAADDYHLTTSNAFWDFGHLLWRPLGWLCFVLTRPATNLLTHGNQRAEAILALIEITFLAALISVLFFFLLARRVIADDWAALLASIGLFSADAFLNYAHTGNAYLAGMACFIPGMYVALPKRPEDATRARASLAGALFAMAVLFWFPYVFVLPAAMTAPLLLCRQQGRIRLLGQTLAVCIGIGFLAYVPAIFALQMRSFADLKAWVLAAGHGQIQAGGLRVVARVAFSLPRSFINMGRDGIWLKRYLVHDPYAPVRAAEMFRLSWWKLIIFYVAAGIVCFQLVRSERGRMLIILLAASALPIIVFGVFIFQAGSIDLYLPLYPFVFLASAHAFRGVTAKAFSSVLLAGVLVAMMTVNLNAMRRGALHAQRSEVLMRVRDLVPILGPNDVVMAVNEQDNLAEFRHEFPLDPINIDHDWQSYDVLEINAARLATWREDFAKHVLACWQGGGVVWLPRRFFHLTPKPEWNWVEGDDKRVKWADLPAFFRRFEVGPAVGGDDGFVPLLDNAKNRAILGAPTKESRVTHASDATQASNLSTHFVALS